LPYQKINSGHPTKFEKNQRGPGWLPDDSLDHLGSFAAMSNIYNGSEATGQKPTCRVVFTVQVAFFPIKKIDSGHPKKFEKKSNRARVASR
jgi:hypothetical protein